MCVGCVSLLCGLCVCGSTYPGPRPCWVSAWSVVSEALLWVGREGPLQGTLIAPCWPLPTALMTCPGDQALPCAVSLSLSLWESGLHSHPGSELGEGEI